MVNINRRNYIVQKDPSLVVEVGLSTGAVEVCRGPQKILSPVPEVVDQFVATNNTSYTCGHRGMQPHESAGGCVLSDSGFFRDAPARTVAYDWWTRIYVSRPRESCSMGDHYRTSLRPPFARPANFLSGTLRDWIFIHTIRR